MKSIKISMLCIAMFSLGLADEKKSVQAVTNFNADKYLGTWYEIARIPNKFQKECVKNSKAVYEKIGNNLSVTNSCETKSGVIKEAKAIAYPQNKDGSILKVSFLPKLLRWIPFTKGDYWIIKIDPNYQVSLVGEPSHQYLWLLSRSPELPKDVIELYLKEAENQGYLINNIMISF